MRKRVLEQYNSNEEEKKNDDDDDDENPQEKKKVCIDVCKNCHGALPPRQQPIVRKRTRRCQKCVSLAAAVERKNDPIKGLQNKLRAYLSKRKVVHSKLTTRESIEKLYNRFEKKSVISGETNAELLTFTTRKAFLDGYEPPFDDFLLVTSLEAHTLSKAKDREIKLAEMKKRY